MIKNNPDAVVTNKVLDKKLEEVVDTLLQGMDNMLVEQKKIFATKEDLKYLEKKVDKGLDEVKTEIGWLKDDIKGLTADLSGVPSIKQFNDLNKKVDKFITS